MGLSFRLTPHRWFKGPVQRDFQPPVFVHNYNLLGTLTNGVKYFRFWLGICELFKFFNLPGVWFPASQSSRRVNKKTHTNRPKVLLDCPLRLRWPRCLILTALTGIFSTWPTHSSHSFSQAWGRRARCSELYWAKRSTDFHEILWNIFLEEEYQFWSNHQAKYCTVLYCPFKE